MIGTVIATSAQKVLLIIGVLLLINAVALALTTSFHTGKILLGFTSVAAILYAIFWNRIPTAGHVVAGAACLAVLAFMSFLAVYGNHDSATYDEDAVVVLGAGLRGEEVGASLARRLDAAIDYHHKNPGAVIVVSGGQGPREGIPEALAMERYLTARGVPRGLVIKEKESTSTIENLRFSAAILEDRFPEGFSAVLITNDFHIYRATRLAQSVGISAKHIGAPTEWYTLVANYLREVPAVVKMWATGPT